MPRPRTIRFRDHFADAGMEGSPSAGGRSSTVLDQHEDVLHGDHGDVRMMDQDVQMMYQHVQMTDRDVVVARTKQNLIDARLSASTQKLYGQRNRKLIRWFENHERYSCNLRPADDLGPKESILDRLIIPLRSDCLPGEEEGNAIASFLADASLHKDKNGQFRDDGAMLTDKSVGQYKSAIKSLYDQRNVPWPPKYEATCRKIMGKCERWL